MVFPYKGILSEAMSNIHNQGVVPGNRRQACADFELNYIECVEAYGLVKGSVVCIKFLEDYKECTRSRLRRYRHMIMKEERFKKVAKGEIEFKKRWGHEYPHDSFVAGTFFP